jgi:tRNA(Ile)-lysidine synthase TilS/MesJ
MTKMHQNPSRYTTTDTYDDYILWKKDQVDMLTGLRGKEVWVLFSGGKDSSLSLSFLNTASEEFGFNFEVHAGAFPNHRYTASEVNGIDAFWRQKGVAIRWHRVEESDDPLEPPDSACLKCQQIRRRFLYEFVSENVVDLSNFVIVTAYTLWDLVSYCLEHVTETARRNPGAEGTLPNQTRFVEVGQRFYPILKMKSGCTVYRPLIKYNKQDVVRIIRTASIPIVSAPCRYAHFRPKRMLEKYYESMQLYFHYSSVLQLAMDRLGILPLNEYESMSNERFLKKIF